jgi:Spy/CpxP family protein refolding chaperone
MRKLAVCALMLAFMVGVSQTSAPRLLAQPPKKDKDTKKDGKKNKASAGSVEIRENAKGKFYYVILNAEGKYAASSNPVSYSTEKEAREALEELKEILASAKVVKGKAKAAEKDK